MNWPRIITAAVLAFAVITLILTVSDFWFDLICGCIVILALWEWSLLKRQSLTVFLLSTVPIAVLVFRGREYPDLLMALCLLSSLAWITIGIDLIVNRLDSFHSVINSYATGLILMSGAWSALALMHGWANVGPQFVISVLLMVWAADTFAYFAGKSFGHRKLVPALSPGKTIQGVFGGVAGTLALAWAAGFAILNLGEGQWFSWLGLGLVIAAVSVIGDLYESRLKRLAGVKDSGRILPGHGGILDRIDSMIAALPIAAAGWSLVR
ncbi:MAG: phosphatidate cytidylyltransferase [Gammaproteobacteria bacterium]|nr:phosphatidate cytidylyltransferase [Gammaproteobacteria bacterium]